MDDLIELAAGPARAKIAPRGAEWRQWSVDGLELLWKPDSAFWDETAPVLFPVCGWTRDGRVRVDGREYPLGLHGFARVMDFEVASRGAHFAELVLRDSEATRALYPFAFELSLSYELGLSALAITARVRNVGREAMPYSFGLHPGFRWPFAGGAIDDYEIVFDEPESAAVPVIAPGGLFSSERRTIDLDGRSLQLDGQTFAREALCFLDARSHGLAFVGPRNRVSGRHARKIGVRTEGFEHIVLWSRPGAPFLCIENWTGYGDPVEFAGELAQKPSMIALAPGEERAHRVTYSHETAA